MTLGARIKARRKEIKWTARELARRANLSPGFLSEVESGKRKPSAQNLLNITKALGLSMDYAMEGEEYAGAHEEVTIPGSLARIADREGWPFTTVQCLVGVAGVIEKHTGKFYLGTMPMDWLKLYRAIEEWL